MPRPKPSEKDDDVDMIDADDDDVEMGATSGLRKLRFSQPLSWPAGRAIAIADLLERLETLAHELRELEQGETDTTSLVHVAQELTSGQLLGHRDKGVRAWTACCVVDILRLCAPNAPYTAEQLKDTFTAIITAIIPALADPSNAYNEQHVYVLSSLAEVKSIVLLTDLESPDTLILQLFSSCFDIVSGSSKSSTGEELAKNVEYDMIRLLVPVIDEASSLSPEVIDIIIAQFLRVDPRVFDHHTGTKNKKTTHAIDPKQQTLLPKEYPPAYDMAKAICNACPEKMTGYVSQYFSSVIIDAHANRSSATNGNASSKSTRVNFENSEDETEDLRELSKAHRLIRELWRACPDVLQNVIPQVEIELSAELVSLRLLATQTIGDLVSGIGVAGPPPPPSMDVNAYPPATLDDETSSSSQLSNNILVTPLAPKPFAQVHSSAYQSFLGRRMDRSPSVRAAWATAIGRIILTSAGGSGLSSSEEKDNLVAGHARMLADADENVRIAAVDVTGTFSFTDVVKKLATAGDLSNSGSLLSVLAERVKDRKQSVREKAMIVLARIWGVASGEIEAGNELVDFLKDIPSRIIDAYYTNNTDIQLLIDHVLYEYLLPLNFPPSKSKSKESKKINDPDPTATNTAEADNDAIRMRRVLTLAANLDDRARKVFFLFQGRQLKMRQFMKFYVEKCEEYNGGINDRGAELKEKMDKVIGALSLTFPEPQKATNNLWKFATFHDRRTYHLIRFAMDVTSDYRTVVKAIRELIKRIQSNPAAPSGLLDTILPLLYRSSSLIFNRSHVPAVLEISRTDSLGLGSIAHEMLKEMSTQNPEVLEAHVQDICKDIEANAPSASSQEGVEMDQILQSCAAFAKKLPGKLPTGRKFIIALTNYALYNSSPKAAKQAVSIIVAISDKKELHARDLVRKAVQEWKYGSKHFIIRLATLSQLNRLAPEQADYEGDAIINIATNEVLLQTRNPQTSSDYRWTDEPDEETVAKEWALRALVNRVLAKETFQDDLDLKSYAEPVFKILNALVTKQGELSKTAHSPATQKSRLRVLAAKLIMKLCERHPHCDHMFSPSNFNDISLVAQDPLLPVRLRFIGSLKKRLGPSKRLGPRWYTIAFLLAYEPDMGFYMSTLTWLRSRTVYFAQQQQRLEERTTMELLICRLLSLLAHHPDYPPPNTPEEESAHNLTDFARYFFFYLAAVANEHNLSLIFHVMQRAKQVRDAISGSDIAEFSRRLYTLSEIAQTTTRRFADAYSQRHRIGGTGGNAANILQTYPGKVRLPSSLFSSLSSHEEAQKIAETSFLPEDFEHLLDALSNSLMKRAKSSVLFSGLHPQQQQQGKSEDLSEATAPASQRTKHLRYPATMKGKRKPNARDRDSSPGDRSPGLGALNGKIQKRGQGSLHKYGQKMAKPSGPRRVSRRISEQVKNISYAEAESDDEEMEGADNKGDGEREESP